jgi:hypothetical protein
LTIFIKIPTEVSHFKERNEKNCLNCNAQVMGKYCHICGQENIEPKESALHLVNHFFQDITHFDGKFFSSLWLLITKPGFLSAEYARGRRANYLNPVRMYVFTSAFFFLIFFSFFKIDKEAITSNSTVNGKTLAVINEMDSSAFVAFTTDINRKDDKPAVPMTRMEFKHYYDSAIENSGISFTPKKYKSKAVYDSLLKCGAEDDGWLVRKLKYKQIATNEKYRGNPREAFKNMTDALLHKLPQMLFISLPLLALLLKLLYFRRKEFYYVSHGIFSLHLYIFIFIALLFLFGLSKMQAHWHWGAFTFLRIILSVSIFFYTYKAMRNFYQQRRAKTVIKFLLLNFLFMFIVLALFCVFLLFSIFTI